MRVKNQSRKSEGEWLAVLFSLPRAQASGRVEVWRRLRRSGAVLLPSGGHVLPDTADNRERFEWLAETVRQYGGAASVLRVSSIDDLPFEKVKAFFVEARAADYGQLIEEIRKLRSNGEAGEAGLMRLRRRFQEIGEIDFFGGKMKTRTENALQGAAEALRARRPRKKTTVADTKKFTNRVWVTRPRPGIDRSASAWLIRNLIDRKAKFRFAQDATSIANGIPFDMYHAGGFGHVGDHCTFETLLQEFKLSGKQLRVLGEMIHDADLKDEKYGRGEAITVDRILKGWAATGVRDEELLRKGMELIDGLYRSIG